MLKFGLVKTCLISFTRYKTHNCIKIEEFLLILLMVASALLRTSSFYESCHLFKNLISPSKVSIFEWLPILQHKLHKSDILIQIPISLRFSAIDSSFLFLELLYFFPFHTLTILMAYSTATIGFCLKFRRLASSLHEQLRILASFLFIHFIF